MVMAGWYVSLNRVVFFSSALFITLAVGVHLTPFLSSLSHLLSSLSDSPLPPFVFASASCLPFLHGILWTSPSNQQPPTWSWPNSGPAGSCGFQKLGRADASDLLNGSWVMAAGDSEARLLVLALLTLILDPSAMDAVRAVLFKRHSNYQIVIPQDGIKVDFIWAPFEVNLTAELHELAQRPQLPEVLVMGTGLWHMLYVTDAADYGMALMSVRKSVEALLSPATTPSPYMFWFGLPTLVNSKLSTRKKARMNDSMCEAYEKEVCDSRILQQSGGPFVLLDIGSLSKGCGNQCTDDGMHYDGAVYEAALQVMFNALLIESHQKI